MEKLVNENFIREITPLSDKDCAEFNLQMQQNSD